VQRTDTRVSGRVARELEERLLVHAAQVHTESGKHVMELQSWSRVEKMRDTGPLRDDQSIEVAVEAIGGKVSTLPWRRRRL
jgi:hypothetical protein